MPPPTVGFVVLQSEPVTLTTELPGRVSAMESSDVRPQINGVIRRRAFVEGGPVRAGQVLYEIEDSPYRAAVLTAQGQLAQAEANIRSTQLQADRFRLLLPINGVSKQDADNAEAASAQAKAAVVAQTDLLNLRAAMSGGDVTQPGPTSARMQLILPNGAVYPIEGVLRFADVTVDPTTGAVVVRATFPNPSGILLPGLYVHARLVEGVRQRGLLAPQSGVTHNERGQATALVLGPGNVVAQRMVQTGQAIGDKWIITDGLKAGDKLIVVGLLNLHPGAKVNARIAADGT